MLTLDDSPAAWTRTFVRLEHKQSRKAAKCDSPTIEVDLRAELHYTMLSNGSSKARCWLRPFGKTDQLLGEGGVFCSMALPSSETCYPQRYCPPHSRLLPNATSKLRRAAFIDRDGVVIEDVGYLIGPSQINLLPHAAEGIRLLQDRFLIVIVTNQSAIARGLLDEEKLISVHQELATVLYDYKALVDAIYACPHHPTFGIPPLRIQCYCRKPQPGMLVEASRDFGIQLNQSVLIRDKHSDILAGQRAGVPLTVLVESHQTNSELSSEVRSTHIANNLYEAARLIIGHQTKLLTLSASATKNNA